MADTSIEIDVRRALADITELKNSLVEVQTEMQRVRAAGKNAFDVGADGALKEARAIEALQREYAELKQASQTLRAASNSAFDPRAISTYTRSVAEVEQGMRKLERAAEAVGADLKNIGKEASTGRQVFEGLFGTLTKATIILAVIDQVRQLAGRALELADNYEKARRSFAAFLGSTERADQVLKSLNQTAKDNFLPVENVQQAGKALLAFGESADNLPSVLTRIANIAAATGKDFNELSLIYGKARTSGVLYAEDINQLTEAGIPIIQEFAKQMGVSTAEVKNLASEGKIGFSELELAFANLTKEGSQFAGQAAAAATESDKLSASVDTLLTKVGEKLKPAFDQAKSSMRGFVDSLTDLFSIESASDFGRNILDVLFKIDGFLNPLGIKLDKLFGTSRKDDLTPDIKRQNQQAAAAFEDQEEIFFRAEEERKKLAQQSAKQRAAEAERLRKQREAEKRELEAHNRRLAELEIEKLAPGSEERALAEEKLRFEIQQAEFQKFNLGTQEIEAQHLKNMLAIRLEFYEKRFNAAENALDAERQADADFWDDRRDAFSQERDLALLEVDFFEAQGRAYIQALRERGASEQEIQLSRDRFSYAAQRKRLEAEISFQEALLRTIDAGDASQIAAIRKRIEQLKLEIQGLDAGGDGEEGRRRRPQTLGDLLGLSDDDQALLNQAAGQVKGFFDEITAARQQAADEARSIADQQVQDAENALETELRLAELGFASNVALKQKQLEEAKKAQDRAIAEQKKAARQQAIIDAAQQASGLATAAVQLFTAHTKIPFVGVALAIGFIAQMLATISKIRSIAKQNTVTARRGVVGRVGDDGVIVGPSHERGGVPLEVEGGEFWGTDGKRFGVVSRKMTEKHFELLRAINKDDRRAMAWHLHGLVNQTAVNKAVSSAPATAADTIPPAADQETKELLRENNRLLREQIRLEKARPQIIDRGSHVIIKTPGREIRLKKEG